MTAPPSSPEGTIDTHRENAVTVLTINRPTKLNALGPSMLSDLERVLEEIDRDPDCRVVIITGAGERAFSVGADINAWAAMQPLDMWRIWVRDGHRVLERLASLRQPTIAALMTALPLMCSYTLSWQPDAVRQAGIRA